MDCPSGTITLFSYW